MRPSAAAEKVEAADLTEAVQEADYRSRRRLRRKRNSTRKGKSRPGKKSWRKRKPKPCASGEETEARAETRGTPGTAGLPAEDRIASRSIAVVAAAAVGRTRHLHSRRNIQRGSAPKITDLLKEGQEILVQIAKEPIGKKGARITSHIALPGRFLVYMPTVDHIGVSRKIASDEERQRLKRVILAEHQGAGGFIVRTAAAGARKTICAPTCASCSTCGRRSAAAPSPARRRR